MTNHRKYGKSKLNMKKSKKQRAQKSKLESTLEMDLVETRDKIEGELATVRPVMTRILKKSSERVKRPKSNVAPTPKTIVSDLNPLNESRKQLRQRTKGQGGAGPAGPGIERRAVGLKTESTATKLLAKIAAKKAARAKN
eukprot:TRINITY_DN10395_c0_g1_i1.p1 TRINITY_DN10395_c0_g1~~TRINITY_DN10395_c0_g1_i1.p1  ORF type:complete len:140 (+),score=16.54 TRINITY_DN10395_c0_g1_i1:58-477(+)